SSYTTLAATFIIKQALNSGLPKYRVISPAASYNSLLSAKSASHIASAPVMALPDITLSLSCPTVYVSFVFFIAVDCE
ncbi:MAG: hypothetical protein K2G79_04760, partial [Muribaculum sp.]|nr:hypothetical protein [Muribaculum sp.]